MNKYQLTAQKAKITIEQDVNNIFQKHNNKLELKFGNYNLLTNENNCISSSTAIGYCMEEFICNYLCYTYPTKYKRITGSTQNSSYDLTITLNDIKILVNFKVVKKLNNAISALKKFKADYIDIDNQEKLFLIFKTNYQIKDKYILIQNINSFYFEQIYIKHLTTDNRSWSKKNDNLSGRMQYNEKTHGLKNISEISYQDTSHQLLSFIDDKISNK